MENPRKDAFKSFIVQELRKRGQDSPASKQELLAEVQAAYPTLCEQAERCYPGCGTSHPKWRHEFDRSLYDLTAMNPPKVRSANQRGFYVIG